MAGGADRLAPGSTIGILGGGQLGRMIALAAAGLGYRCHVFCSDRGAPAAQVSAAATVADYDDTDALAQFAAAIDVAKFEFENIPLAPVAALAARVPVRPGPRALELAQDRIKEKDFLTSIDVPVTAYRPVTNEGDLASAVADLGAPAILKTARWGYDGKGQARIGPDTDAGAAWRDIGGGPAVLEAVVDFTCEISVIQARGMDGAMAGYAPVENRHVDHILDSTIAPAAIAAAVAGRARDIAARIAEELDLVGLVAVEMFVTRDGAVLVNEIAPRPHNSGHWTLDACATSQFAQLVRAICGLPLGSPERHCDAVMNNLVGHAVDAWPDLLAEPGARLHLYGKHEVRPGRKMGHVTRLTPRRD